jgi:hypothetical protein
MVGQGFEAADEEGKCVWDTAMTMQVVIILVIVALLGFCSKHIPRNTRHFEEQSPTCCWACNVTASSAAPLPAILSISIDISSITKNARSTFAGKSSKGARCSCLALQALGFRVGGECVHGVANES